MPVPLKIQFAFQGGGAKVIALLAVAEAIQDFERDGKIQITRVAGTSAGSIVACFVAAGIRADNIAAELRGGTGQRLIQQFKLPNRVGAIWKLFVSKGAIWDTAPLRAWLVEKFQDKNIVRVGDISKRVPLVITRTNLGSRACNYAPDSDIVANAVIDSCALPYLFRIWSKSNAGTFVDGGISNNLPAASLSGSSAEHGELIAISFSEFATDHPGSFLTFSAALLDTAMSSTMGLVKEAHKDKLMEVPTGLGTFDFEQALSPGFAEPYKQIKAWAASELQKRIDRIESERTIAIRDPWQETNPTAVKVMELLGEAYKQSLGKSLLRYDSCKLVVYSNGGRPPSDPYRRTPDKAQFEFVFHSGNVPTYCISAGLVGQSNESTFAADSAECVVTDASNKRLDFIKVPMRTDAVGTRELCLFFTPALPPNSGPYTVKFEENGENIMAGLFEKNKDEMGYHPQRPDGPVGRVDLALFVHKDVELILSSRDPARPGQPMAWQSVISGPPLFPNMKGYCMYAENVASPWELNVVRVP